MLDYNGTLYLTETLRSQIATREHEYHSQRVDDLQTLLGVDGIFRDVHVGVLTRDVYELINKAGCPINVNPENLLRVYDVFINDTTNIMSAGVVSYINSNIDILYRDLFIDNDDTELDGKMAQFKDSTNLDEKMIVVMLYLFTVIDIFFKEDITIYLPKDISDVLNSSISGDVRDSLNAYFTYDRGIYEQMKIQIAYVVTQHIQNTYRVDIINSDIFRLMDKY